jgi:glutathione S-transferase
MLLIGQFDSPFVRRVGIALKHYGIAFEHAPFSVFRDAAEIARYSPLRKVPTLVLDDGLVIVESSHCLDVIDRMASDAHVGAALLLPASGPERTRGLSVCGFAMGAMEKAVSLVYEAQLRDRAFAPWVERCTTQVNETLLLLERLYAQSPRPYLFGNGLSHPDIAVSCLLTFIDGAYPQASHGLPLEALRAVQRSLEATPHFREISQPFDIPKPKA